MTLNIAFHGLTPALHILILSSSVFSLELSASATAGCLLLPKQMKPIWCLDQPCCIFTKL